MCVPILLWLAVNEIPAIPSLCGVDFLFFLQLERFFKTTYLSLLSLLFFIIITWTFSLGYKITFTKEPSGNVPRTFLFDSEKCWNVETLCDCWERTAAMTMKLFVTHLRRRSGVCCICMCWSMRFKQSLIWLSIIQGRVRSASVSGSGTLYDLCLSLSVWFCALIRNPGFYTTYIIFFTSPICTALVPCSDIKSASFWATCESMISVFRKVFGKQYWYI